MAQTDETRKIIDLLAGGKITAEEAEKLMSAMKPSSFPQKKGRRIVFQIREEGDEIGIQVINYYDNNGFESNGIDAISEDGNRQALPLHTFADNQTPAPSPKLRRNHANDLRVLLEQY